MLLIVITLAPAMSRIAPVAMIDPWPFMRRGTEATVAQRAIDYANAGNFVDEWLSFDWRAESEEIPSDDLKRFRKEAIEAVSPLSKGPRFHVVNDMIFFTGLKE